MPPPYLLLCLMCFLPFTMATYYIDQIENAKYQIDIDRLPAGFPLEEELDEKLDSTDLGLLEKTLLDRIPDPLDTSFVFLTSKSGQRFACKVPEFLPKQETPQLDTPNPKYVSQIVAAGFYVRNCISKALGWWTYEVCRGKSIRQFHSKKEKSDYAEYSLGMFTGEYSMPEYSSSTKERLLYLEESYRGGSTCDVLGKQIPRKTGVRYECDPLLSTSEAYILSVNEVSSCEYVITVKLGSLCKLPQFIVPEELEKPQQIECRPFVDSSSLSRYVQKAFQRKQAKKDAKAKLPLLERKQAMLRQRRKAFKRTSLIDDDKYNKKIEKRLDRETAAVTEAYVMAYGTAKFGEAPTGERLVALQKMFKLTNDADFQLETFSHGTAEDRAYLWEYFMDPEWPKDEYPKSPDYVDLINAYRSEAKDRAELADADEAKWILKKYKLDPWKEENNVLIDKIQIFGKLDSYIPSWYFRESYGIKGYTDALLVDPVYKTEVVDDFIESLIVEFKKGEELAVTRRELVYEIARNLAPLSAMFEVLGLPQNEGGLVMKSFVDLFEKLVVSLDYAQVTFELRSPSHRLSFKGKFTDQEKKAVANEYFNEYFNRHVKKLTLEERKSMRAEYERVLGEQTTLVRHSVFMELWEPLAKQLVKDRRKVLKLEAIMNLIILDSDLKQATKSNALQSLLREEKGNAFTYTLNEQAELFDLISEAGLQEGDVKIQVLGIDGEGEEMSESTKKIIDEFVEEAIHTMREKNVAGKREKAYWSRFEDVL